VQVSNPQTDFEFGPSSGFTESETSTAWCGSNVVVAYNDSGSFWESGFATNFQNLSFNGFSTSENQGRTYLDRGFLPSATANPTNFLEGDPVVACTSASTFYYSSLFFTVASFSPFTPLTAISVSKSTTEGASFGAPVSAASKHAFTHFLAAVSGSRDSAILLEPNARQTTVIWAGVIVGTGIAFFLEWRYSRGLAIGVALQQRRQVRFS